MFRVINEYLSKVNLQSNDQIYNMITSYLAGNKDILKYTVTVNFKRYMLDIKLKDYSVDNVVKMFNDLIEHISYPYSSMHVRFNEGKCVRYRYITCNENKNAFYCDMIFG